MQHINIEKKRKTKRVIFNNIFFASIINEIIIPFHIEKAFYSKQVSIPFPGVSHTRRAYFPNS